MTSAMLLLLLWATPVKLEPAALTFGPAESPLEVLAPGAVAVKVWCGSCGNGAVSAAEPVSPGRFRVRFTAPKERFPRVVLLGVEARAENGAKQVSWVALPLMANASLKLETKPQAAVTVTIGAKSFGPLPADARGKLTLPVVVPPGFPSATVVAADRAGNVTTTSLDLAAQPFPRAAVLVPEGEAGADQRLELEVFAVEPDGAPLVDASRLRILSRLGTVETPLARGGGVFTVGYRAPKSVSGGPDTVSVAVEGSPPMQLEVPVRAAQSAQIVLSLDPPEFTAGSGTKVMVVAQVADANGNPVRSLTPTITTDFGAVTPSGAGAQLTVPDAFGGRRQVRVRAAAGGVTGETTLKLIAGPAVTAELRMPGQAAAGTLLTGTLSAKDTWGNPVSANAISVVGGSGHQAQLSPGEGSDLVVGYQTAQDEVVGPQTIQVRAGERTLTRSELSVYPYQRDWALAAGAFLSGSSNFSQARALSPRLSFAVRLAGLPLEVGVEGAFAWFPRLSEARTVDGANTVDLEMTAWSGALAVRYSLQVAIRWSVQLSAVLGAQHTQSTLTAPGLTTVQSSHWGPLVRGSGGVALHALGGRVLLQLEYGYAPLGDGNVRGNAAGAGLALGYLASF